jgi:hypothetical protein
VPNGTEPCRGQSKELGMLLPIPASLADALARADKLESGYLSHSLKKLGGPSYSVAVEGKDVIGDLLKKRKGRR